MTNETANHIDIARQVTVPHGDSKLAVGTADVSEGPPDIFDINGLSIGVNQGLANRYLSPYKHFHDNLVEGLFDPLSPNDLLKVANDTIDIMRPRPPKSDAPSPWNRRLWGHPA